MLPGLIETEKLTGYGYDAKKSGLEGEKSGSSLPQVRGDAGGGAGEESPALARQNGDLGRNLEKNTTTGERGREPHRSRSVVRRETQWCGCCWSEVMALVVKRKRKPEPRTPLRRLLEEHLEWLLVKNYSEDTADHAR